MLPDGHKPCVSGPGAQRKKFRWVVEGVEYCDEYFGRIFGVSKDKMRSVRRLIVGGLAAETGALLRPLAPRVRYNQCVGFWREFFTNCQRPTTRHGCSR